MSSTQGLVGREAELALAAAAVRRLSEGRASVLVIEGEAGIGKTRLVQSIIDDARSREVAVFCGQAHPFERTRPFGVVAGALGVSRRSRTLAGLQSARCWAARRVALPRRLPATSSTGSSRRSWIWWRCRAPSVRCCWWPRTSTGPTAPASQRSSVVRRLPLAALLVVVTARPSSMPVEVVRLLDDLAAGDASTVQLQPLKSEDVVVLAGQVIGASPRSGPERHVGQGRREPLVGRRHGALAGR